MLNVKTGRILVNPYGENLLCATVAIDSNNVPIKYSYRVTGKTTDVDFVYSIDNYVSDNLFIPVVGLYANTVNKVELTFEDEMGDTYVEIVYIDTNGQDYGDGNLNITYQVTDSVMAQETINQGWMISSLYYGYDKNGDLRFAHNAAWNMNDIKIHENSLYSGKDVIESSGFAKTLIKRNLLGETKAIYNAPDGYGFHHDITFDNNGNLYALGSNLDAPTDSLKGSGLIFKYNEATGQLLWQRDYSADYTGQDVCVDATQNDIHFNSLYYVKDANQLILNCRSTSAIMGIDMDTGDVVWIVDDPQFSIVPAQKQLTVLNPEVFEYPDGQHCVTQTFVSKYSQYSGPNRFALSLFNNRAALNSNRTQYNKKIEDGNTDKGEPFDSSVFILGIDLNSNTVELLDSFTINGHRSEFESSVFDINEYYSVLYGFEVPANFFVIDTDNNVGVSAYSVYHTTLYRARIFTYDALRALI